ncbi:MAG: peptidyl-prolyl cis-trans isomerase [Gammaproteobacteria bacterium]|nr:MAG: peptidyl-prolyl cis-trans isomerase [Gammaproteobacteria bacterium]
MKFLKEPLFHFLALGAALFLLYGLVSDDSGGSQNQLVVTRGDIRQLADMWQMQWRRPPTPRELQGLVDAHVKEQILYREALAMGLDQDDTIVRRRLAQKMEFLAQDIARWVEPTDEDLRTFLAENPELFRTPVEVTFTHVYVSPDQRGASARQDAEALLTQLRTMGPGADTSAMGDRFMLQKHYSAAEWEIARLFGSQFAADVVALEPGDWQGPVESGYGLHVVLVQDRIEARMPPLDEVHEQVKNEYMSVRQREANEAMYELLRSRYDVTIEDFAGIDPATGGATEAE